MDFIRPPPPSPPLPFDRRPSNIECRNVFAVSVYGRAEDDSEHNGIVAVALVMLSVLVMLTMLLLLLVLALAWMREATYAHKIVATSKQTSRQTFSQSSVHSKVF